MVGLFLHPFILLKLPEFECLAEKGSFIISLPSQHCPDLLSFVSAVLGNVQNAGWVHPYHEAHGEIWLRKCHVRSSQWAHGLWEFQGDFSALNSFHFFHRAVSWVVVCRGIVVSVQLRGLCGKAEYWKQAGSSVSFAPGEPLLSAFRGCTSGGSSLGSLVAEAVAEAVIATAPLWGRLQATLLLNI